MEMKRSYLRTLLNSSKKSSFSRFCFVDVTGLSFGIANDNGSGGGKELKRFLGIGGGGGGGCDGVETFRTKKAV